MKAQTLSPRNAASRLVFSAVVLAACFSASPVLAQSTPTYNPYAGTVVVKKFYDANANGVRDTGEPWLTGWPMTLTGNGVDSTRNSTATFTGLVPPYLAKLALDDGIRQQDYRAVVIVVIAFVMVHALLCGFDAAE